MQARTAEMCVDARQPSQNAASQLRQKIVLGCFSQSWQVLLTTDEALESSSGDLRSPASPAAEAAAAAAAAEEGESCACCICCITPSISIRSKLRRSACDADWPAATGVETRHFGQTIAF